MWPRALAALRHLRLDMHVLVCLSAAGAAAVGQWAEAAAVAFLFALAHRLEAWSLERAREALASVADRGVLSADGSQPSAPVERWIERFAAVYTPGRDAGGAGRRRRARRSSTGCGRSGSIARWCSWCWRARARS